MRCTSRWCRRSKRRTHREFPIASYSFCRLFHQWCNRTLEQLARRHKLKGQKNRLECWVRKILMFIARFDANFQLWAMAKFFDLQNYFKFLKILFVKTTFEVESYKVCCRSENRNYIFLANLLFSTFKLKLSFLLSLKKFL